MEPINLNHAQILYSSAGIKPTNEITSSSSNAPQSTPAEIKISSQDPIVAHDSNIKSRFSSMEEQSQHKTKIVAQWVTLAELESGIRRPYETTEDERLGKLSLKELMEESNNLPRVDQNGHLQSGFAGTEQGDRISVAIANKILEAQYDYRKSTQSVESAIKDFKLHIEKKLNIAPSSYDIVFRNGKITAQGKVTDAASMKNIQKIQEVLDNPKNLQVADTLSTEIDRLNKAALALVENELTQYIYGAIKDPYLQKNISIDWLMEGMNYSNATESTQVNYKFTSIIADAREKYHAAIKNGTHLSNYDIDPGIIELTNLRKNIDVNA